MLSRGLQKKTTRTQDQESKDHSIEIIGLGIHQTEKCGGAPGSIDSRRSFRDMRGGGWIEEEPRQRGQR